MTDAPGHEQEAARLGIAPSVLQDWLDARKGIRRPGMSRALHVMAKPGGSACNLDCTYCYYLSKEGLLAQDRARMDEAMLERFVADTIAAQDGEEIVFTWHGGEPTLMGLPFFETVVALQARHAPAGRRIVNDLQTNGVLLDDSWCAFLARHGFLVGLSIDGPRALHDAYRPRKGGQGSFDAVVAAAARLRAHGVPFATLTVINRSNAREPLAVYRFLRDTLGARHLQFIPCVEPRGFEHTAPDRHAALPRARTPQARATHPDSVVTEWSVAPADWGRFLIAVFEEWVQHDRGRVKVNHLESFLLQMRGQAGLQCTSSPICGKNVAIEHDGTVYACDHYVYPEHALGKLGEDNTLASLVFSVRQLEFGLNKARTLPGECRRCPYLSLCWGECPRTRLLRTREGEGNLSWLCEGWKLFFGHAIPRARTLGLA